MAILGHLDQRIIGHSRTICDVQTLQAQTIVRNGLQSVICDGHYACYVESQQALATMYQGGDAMVGELGAARQSESFNPFAGLKWLNRSVIYFTVQVGEVQSSD